MKAIATADNMSSLATAEIWIITGPSDTFTQVLLLEGVEFLAQIIDQLIDLLFLKGSCGLWENVFS